MAQQGGGSLLFILIKTQWILLPDSQTRRAEQKTPKLTCTSQRIKKKPNLLVYFSDLQIPHWEAGGMIWADFGSSVTA